MASNPTFPTISLGTPSIQTTPSSIASSTESPSPDSVENILDTLVEEMSDEQLTEYVKRCSVLRSSAQTRKAQLVKESVEEHGAKRKSKKKDSIAEALALLASLKNKP